MGEILTHLLPRWKMMGYVALLVALSACANGGENDLFRIDDPTWIELSYRREGTEAFFASLPAHQLSAPTLQSTHHALRVIHTLRQNTKSHYDTEMIAPEMGDWIGSLKREGKGYQELDFPSTQVELEMLQTYWAVESLDELGLIERAVVPERVIYDALESGLNQLGSPGTGADILLYHTLLVSQRLKLDIPKELAARLGSVLQTRADQLLGRRDCAFDGDVIRLYDIVQTLKVLDLLDLRANNPCVTRYITSAIDAIQANEITITDWITELMVHQCKQYCVANNATEFADNVSRRYAAKIESMVDNHYCESNAFRMSDFANVVILLDIDTLNRFGDNIERCVDRHRGKSGWTSSVQIDPDTWSTYYGLLLTSQLDADYVDQQAAANFLLKTLEESIEVRDWWTALGAAKGLEIIKYTLSQDLVTNHATQYDSYIEECADACDSVACLHNVVMTMATLGVNEIPQVELITQQIKNHGVPTEHVLKYLVWIREIENAIGTDITAVDDTHFNFNTYWVDKEGFSQNRNLPSDMRSAMYGVMLFDEEIKRDPAHLDDLVTLLESCRNSYGYFLSPAMEGDRSTRFVTLESTYQGFVIANYLSSMGRLGSISEN